MCWVLASCWNIFLRFLAPKKFGVARFRGLLHENLPKKRRTNKQTNKKNMAETTPQQVGLIIVGNSGVGKSWLANVLLKKEQFTHEYKPSAVTLETEVTTATLKAGTIIKIFNIPGLIENDQERIEKNKVEIDKAFQQSPTSIVVYVFGNQGGRIRNEDVVAFNALRKAYDIVSKSLCLVVNMVRPGGSATYEAETIHTLQKLLHLPTAPEIGFIDEVLPGGSKEQAYMTLQKIIQKCTPSPHKKVEEIDLDSDRIKALVAKVEEEKQALQKELEGMQSRLVELQNLVEQERNKPPQVIVVDGGSGCSIC
eukprot:TRINITY_DN12928_c0_g1_i1.p2 TRINITY_DN12928_c0_g1~~TRINITY_DN12928_c0_g1_i1.p2  ORF type:complete len:310 (+),score=83.31 TRINITY_DN12928_c0_g1_i1:843-1772(+)